MTASMRHDEYQQNPRWRRPAAVQHGDFQCHVSLRVRSPPWCFSRPLNVYTCHVGIVVVFDNAKCGQICTDSRSCWRSPRKFFQVLLTQQRHRFIQFFRCHSICHS